MTTTAPARDTVRDAIAKIRRIIAEENSEHFSNDELLDACIDLVQADDTASENERAAAPAGPINFLATLDAAVHRASSYDEDERAIITRAVTRANRSLANR